MPHDLTVSTINLYCAEHAQLAARKDRMRKSEFAGELISLRIKYRLSFDDVDLSIR